MIYQTLRTLVNLCLLRASPAELLYSFGLLGVFVLLGAALNGFTLFQLNGVSWTEVVLATALSLILLISLIYLLLAKRKASARLNKVLIAWFGTEILLALVLKTFLLITPESIQVMKMVQIILQVGFFTWNVIVKAYILRQGCEIKMVNAVLMTFGILVVSSLPIQFILGPYLAESIPQA